MKPFLAIATLVLFAAVSLATTDRQAIWLLDDISHTTTLVMAHVESGIVRNLSALGVVSAADELLDQFGVAWPDGYALLPQTSHCHPEGCPPLTGLTFYRARYRSGSNSVSEFGTVRILAGRFPTASPSVWI